MSFQALQIFVIFLFIKIIDDGLEIRSFWFLEFGWLEFEYLNLMASFSSSLCTRKLRWVFGSLNMTF
ncbi:hypothetical protein RhiirA1_476816 [Rhizophagus irregularis]|uniref:Uncharacterized protein n=1 Tax=Rhizophagus irregularis TaxID=588596 RepID=A0A2N0QUH1_9GLOM|nr:hypothetical protein RhiirA1_476816 [Rhizophagus irregularis]